MAKNKVDIFPAFPKFRALTLADRDAWEDLIADYPPIASYSFPNLMTWWSPLEPCKVSTLNGNVIICYWVPGSENMSGLCVVGNKKIDETFCEIFDWQKATGRKPRLVNVPDFVIDNVRYHDMFKFSPDSEQDEFLVPIARFMDPKTIPIHKRWKVRMFLDHMTNKGVLVKSLDMSDESNQELLIEALEDWRHKGPLNDTSNHELASHKQAIINADVLGLEVAVLYIEGELHGYLIYERCADPEYALMDFAGISYGYPHLLDYFGYMMAKYFDEEGIKQANLLEDVGAPDIRSMKLAFGPFNFFRKYIVEPKGSKK